MNEQLHSEALTNFLKCLDFDIDLQAHHFNEDADPVVVGEAFMQAYRTNFEEYHGEDWIDARVPVYRACDIEDSLLAKAMGWDQPAFPCLKKGEIFR